MPLTPKTIRQYHIFLASPGDVSEERQYVRQFFEQYNRTTAHVWKAQFVVVDWENYATTGIGRPQELITQQTLERFRDSLALVVGIMGQRFGSPSGKAESGTEEEFNWAMDSHLNSGFPEIKWFFRKVDTLEMPADLDQLDSAVEQWKKVLDFRKRMRDMNNPLFYKEYSNPAKFAELFDLDLSQWLADPLRPWAVPQSQSMQRSVSLLPDQQDGRHPYTPAELDAWVERHQGRLAAAFEALQVVQDRRVHVPLEVRLALATGAKEASRLLDPADLELLLRSGGNHVLLLSGDGGAGKTSLAFAIARWWLAGEPGEVVRIPVLIETALSPREMVVDRVRGWLGGQLAGAPEGDLEPALVEALLQAKRLIPIVDRLSELTPAAREQLLAALPPGLVVVTSRSDDDGFHERPLSRIVPQRIAVERLQAFFLDYLRRKGQGEALSDDDLMPAQTQLKRIVGDKPMTVLLAQMFIDDVIANREEGLLARSVPALMLSYVKRLDTPADPALRRRAGLVISGEIVQLALRVVALASHRQKQNGEPLFQPLEFSDVLAREALEEAKPVGLALKPKQAAAVLTYLNELRLLQQSGARAGQLRFPLDPLADHLAATEQVEQLEKQALVQGPEVWEVFVAALEKRAEAERGRMRGFLLALRDGAMEAQGGRALAMPKGIPDRLAELGLLDPQGERYRFALQRARKLTWELEVEVASDRRYGITKLAAMAGAPEESERRAARNVASRRLARLLVEVVPEQQAELREEQKEAALVLGLIGSEAGTEALMGLARNGSQSPELRRAALEALGLVARDLPVGENSKLRARIERFLEGQLRADSLDLLVTDEAGWEEHDRRLPLLQGASRGLQLAASAELPLLCSGAGRAVPMLTLTALQEGEALRIRTEVVTPAVWRLPLPEWPGDAPQQLELVVVPGGDYLIGSPEQEEGRNVYPQSRQKCDVVNVEAQRPVRQEGFGLLRHPISQAQWRAVAALPEESRSIPKRPSAYEAKGLWEIHAQPGGLAVDSVDWNACQEWLRRLNRWLKDQWPELGGLGEAPQLALPSESQWEVACRAGSSTPFHFGVTLDESWANYNSRMSYGPGRQGDCRQRPVPVGCFGLVNRWGLAELHGQMYEWCADLWRRDPLANAQGHGSALDDPDPELEGNQEQAYRVLRGGSWLINPHFSRAAMRVSISPDYDAVNIGVRPAVSLPQVLLGSTAARKMLEK